LNPKTFFCRKCNQHKEESEFWFDKRRGTVRTPCKDCSNKQKRHVRGINYLQNKVSRTDILNHYASQGLPDAAIEFFTDLVLLNRTIKDTQKPMFKNIDNLAFAFCPTCGELEKIELPCEIERLTKFLTSYTEIHRHNEI
jgi:transcription elongation factor Elf1